jgi:LPS-assembly lipoprotein
MNRRTILAAGGVCAALLLGSCGFRPLYGEGSAGSAENLASIRVEPIQDRTGQKLYTLLQERLTPRGVPARPDYTLEVRLQEGVQDLAIRKDESATRSNLVISASYSLRSNDPQNPRSLEGQATSSNSFDRVTSEFATLSAQENARDRALRTLADEIRTRIAAALENPQAFMRLPAAGTQTRQQQELERRRSTNLGPFLPPPQ